MNELLKKVNGFENKVLLDASETIIGLQKNVNQSLLSVAGVVGEVVKNGSYKDDFKTPVDWLMKTFNYKKSTAYSLLEIGKNYVIADVDNKYGILPIYHTIFRDNKTDEDFLMTQLEKLLPLGIDVVRMLLATGKLSYDMTVKEIRELVKETRNIESEDVESENSEENAESANSEETEPETEETETEIETEAESKECVATIEIWNNCFFVNNEKYDFNDLNEVVKYIRKTVKGLNK